MDHARGPASARVTLLEYGDYTCPYCALAHDVVRRIEAAIVGDVRFVFRHFSTAAAHPRARAAARLAEAAALQGRFWPVHDGLFEQRRALEAGDLQAAVRTVDVDWPRLVRDAASVRVDARVEADRRKGAASGVDCTPTFFVNGHRYVGSWDYSSLSSHLVGLLG
jgi:Na+:H+ antiporter, NhaA family